MPILTINPCSRNNQWRRSEWVLRVLTCWIKRVCLPAMHSYTHVPGRYWDLNSTYVHLYGSIQWVSRLKMLSRFFPKNHAQPRFIIRTNWTAVVACCIFGNLYSDVLSEGATSWLASLAVFFFSSPLTYKPVDPGSVLFFGARPFSWPLRISGWCKTYFKSKGQMEMTATTTEISLIRSELLFCLVQ